MLGLGIAFPATPFFSHTINIRNDQTLILYITGRREEDGDGREEEWGEGGEGKQHA